MKVIYVACIEIFREAIDEYQFFKKGNISLIDSCGAVSASQWPVEKVKTILQKI